MAATSTFHQAPGTSEKALDRTRLHASADKASQACDQATDASGLDFAHTEAEDNIEVASRPSEPACASPAIQGPRDQGVATAAPASTLGLPNTTPEPRNRSDMLILCQLTSTGGLTTVRLGDSMNADEVIGAVERKCRRLLEGKSVWALEFQIGGCTYNVEQGDDNRWRTLKELHAHASDDTALEAIVVLEESQDEAS